MLKLSLFFFRNHIHPYRNQERLNETKNTSISTRSDSIWQKTDVSQSLECYLWERVSRSGPICDIFRTRNNDHTYDRNQVIQLSETCRMLACIDEKLYYFGQMIVSLIIQFLIMMIMISFATVVILDIFRLYFARCVRIKDIRNSDR